MGLGAQHVVILEVDENNLEKNEDDEYNDVDIKELHNVPPELYYDSFSKKS